MTLDLLLRNVVVDGRSTDVLVADGIITEIGPALRPDDDVEEVDGAGGALVPGLHDHHIHLLAAAAARSSVAIGPADVGDDAGLIAALRRADAALPPGRWLRAVGHHESVGGLLDRDRLDEIAPGRPVRVQHRSGALWVLSSAALDALRADETAPDGAERDATGRLTGRVFRADDWLRARLPDADLPELAEVGRELALVGVTAVTDATPFRALGDLAALAAATEDGSLPQHVHVTGSVALADATFPASLRRGPVKIVLDEADLPPLDDLIDQIAHAHRSDRPVAVHCVTRATLALVLVAWEAAGAQPGDRIEHGAVIPPELRSLVARHGLTVVTQPGFVAERGDQYLTDVDPDDLPHLYPCRSLLEAGIEVGFSSDAPYTSLDPWAAMRAAATRATRAGQVLGASEIVTPAEALGRYLGPADRPGGPPRRVAVGQPADLCLLDGPLPTTVDDLRADRVLMTFVGGQVS